jgi:hypothetical protein
LDDVEEEEEKPKKKSKKKDEDKLKKTSDSQKDKAKKKKADVPFHEILRGVKFVISGIQNPDRGHLREMAIKMGAKYRPDWDDETTHLIGVSASAPKAQEAAKNKKAKIITRNWIEDCYHQKTRFDEDDYSLLDGNNRGKKRKLSYDDTEEEEEDLEDDDNEIGSNDEEQLDPDAEYEPPNKKMKSDDSCTQPRQTKKRAAKSKSFKDIYGPLDSNDDSDEEESLKKKKIATGMKGFDDLSDDDDVTMNENNIQKTSDTNRQKTSDTNSQKKEDSQKISNLKYDSQKQETTNKKDRITKKENIEKKKSVLPEIDTTDSADIERLKQFHEKNDPQGSFYSFISNLFDEAITMAEKNNIHEYFNEFKLATSVPKIIRKIARLNDDERIIRELKKSKDKYCEYVSSLEKNNDQDLNDKKDCIKGVVDGPNEKLIDIFSDIHVYLDPDLSNDDKRMLKRYIVAYNGDIDTKCISGTTTHVIVESDEHGQKYLNHDYKVVVKDWIVACHNKRKRLTEGAYQVLAD